VNGAAPLEALERDRIIANPNCCAIPAHDDTEAAARCAGLKSVHVATYQSVSGAGGKAIGGAQGRKSAEHNLIMDWTWEARTPTRSRSAPGDAEILELPELPVAPTCVRVRVLVGHSEAIWIELEDDLSPEQAADAAERRACACSTCRFRPPRRGRGQRGARRTHRRDPTVARGLSLYLSCDNLRKGAR